jgi:hypothetical protein
VPRGSKSTPEQALIARAGWKIKAAERRENDAVRLRLEAADLLHRYDTYRARLAAERNVAERASA